MGVSHGYRGLQAACISRLSTPLWEFPSSSSSFLFFRCSNSFLLPYGSFTKFLMSPGPYIESSILSTPLWEFHIVNELKGIREEMIFLLPYGSFIGGIAGYEIGKTSLSTPLWEFRDPSFPVSIAVAVPFYSLMGVSLRIGVVANIDRAIYDFLLPYGSFINKSRIEWLYLY